jgi:hypothetical protein
MKRFIFTFIAILFVLSLFSQGTKQEVISSAGGNDTGNGISISWTLGETIIPTFKSADNSLVLTHGFQQQLIITAIEENIEVLINVKIYPNPAGANINIKFETPVVGVIRVFLLNSRGEPVKTDQIESAASEKQINMQDMPAGLYFIKLIKGKLTNVYKVVKL